MRLWIAGVVVLVSCTERSTPDGYVRVPAGVFVMGADEDDPMRGDDEGPRREVRITRSLYVKKTEVTQREWVDVMGKNTSNMPGCGGDCPMNNVRFVDAVVYLNRLSARSDLERCYHVDGDNVTSTGPSCAGYRLPTEAEWAYFARAGSSGATDRGVATSTTCESDPILDEIAWYCGNATTEFVGCYDARWVGGPACAGIQRVGTKAPNDFGLYDVLGNVWEWTGDWYAPDAYEKGPLVDPTGPARGTQRVMRGGGWLNRPRMIRLSARYRATVDNPLDMGIGLRPVRTED